MERFEIATKFITIETLKSMGYSYYKIGKLEKLGIAPKRSNAKIKTGSRLSGPESVIPKELGEDEVTD